MAPKLQTYIRMRRLYGINYRMGCDRFSLLLVNEVSSKTETAFKGNTP